MIRDWFAVCHFAFTPFFGFILFIIFFPEGMLFFFFNLCNII